MAGTFYQRDGRITSSATDTPAMTDPTPTPTRAEVERCEPGHYGEMDRHPEGEWVRFTDYQALRERAEAAERAEASAWNDAIEAAAEVANSDGEGEWFNPVQAIRALRRAAPTEGEA